MSEDQVRNLYGILDNEKRQLAEAEAAYAQENQKPKNTNPFDESAYLKKKQQRETMEAQHEAEEDSMEEDILAELAKL